MHDNPSKALSGIRSTATTSGSICTAHLYSGNNLPAAMVAIVTAGYLDSMDWITDVSKCPANTQYTPLSTRLASVLPTALSNTMAGCHSG